MINLEASIDILREHTSIQKYMLDSKNPQFKRILQILDRAADSSANILLLGESGVGKGVLSNYIHQKSRPDKNFLTVNCHSLSQNIIESELFGHEKGAFTGADSLRKGRFEAVDGGTLFLDEIGDIPLNTQAKLLVTLENHTIERMGSNKSIDVDFRLISATNIDMDQAIKDQSLREDLFYRISTIMVEIPPLRARKEDLPGLIAFFTEKLSLEMKKKIDPFPNPVLQALLTYDYPGNIRELKNIIERLIVLSSNGEVSIFDLPDNVYNQDEGLENNFANNKSLHYIRAEAEKNHIIEVLKTYNNNISESANILEISQRQLYNKIKEYDIVTKLN